MRRHDARKWLHAILDLLPVILIPVFMIYSHRHTIDSYSLDVPQYRVVDFNQKVSNGNFNSSNDYVPSPNGSLSVSDNIGTLTYIQNDGSLSLRLRNSQISVDTTHIYYWKSSVLVSKECEVSFNQAGARFNYQTLLPNSWNDFSIVRVPQNQYSNIGWEITLNSNIQVNDTFKFKNFQVFDLTQMFGSGNEPTKEQFDEWYTNDYYNYTLSHKELLKGYSTITYDDTDIMSQFTYNLYNSVDKYFNMNNIFGLNGVYDWFNLNIFNGNAPLYIYVVWNIVLYEFVMDLLMLLYALFMWFIDFCQDLIDRCFTTSKGGKH